MPHSRITCHHLPESWRSPPAQHLREPGTRDFVRKSVRRADPDLLPGKPCQLRWSKQKWNWFHLRECARDLARHSVGSFEPLRRECQFAEVRRWLNAEDL